MMPVTRAWHIGDVILGVADFKKKPSWFEVARLIYALVGLAGNIIIEHEQVRSNVIEVGGKRWKKLD